MGNMDSDPVALIPAFKLERILNQGKHLLMKTYSPVNSYQTKLDGGL
jgi:hypothetical protein